MKSQKHLQVGTLISYMCSIYNLIYAIYTWKSCYTLLKLCISHPNHSFHNLKYRTFTVIYIYAKSINHLTFWRISRGYWNNCGRWQTILYKIHESCTYVHNVTAILYTYTQTTCATNWVMLWHLKELCKSFPYIKF